MCVCVCVRACVHVGVQPEVPTCTTRLVQVFPALDEVMVEPIRQAKAHYEHLKALEEEEHLKALEEEEKVREPSLTHYTLLGQLECHHPRSIVPASTATINGQSRS